jgi:hypothetical protein
VNLRPGTSLPASTLIVGCLVWAIEFSLLKKATNRYADMVRWGPNGSRGTHKNSSCRWFPRLRRDRAGVVRPIISRPRKRWGLDAAMHPPFDPIDRTLARCVHMHKE